MKHEAIFKTLSTIVYPGLEKNIVALKVVNNIAVHNEALYIELQIAKNDIFELIKQKILSCELQEKYPAIHITNKMTSTPLKKDILYGSSNNPNNRAPYAKKIIVVSSGKGGVGKSTVSANLAVGLAQKGYKVGLLDADIYGPNIPKLLGVGDEKLRWSDDNKIIPSENFGIKIMSVALTTPTDDTPLVWRSSVAVSALIQFLEDVAWGELDFLIIDMPPGTGDVQLTMAQELPISLAVIVTTPQQLSLADVSRAIMMFKETNVTIGGIIENMSYFIAPDTGKHYNIFGIDGAKKICTKYSIDLLGSIPLLCNISSDCENGKPSIATNNTELKKIYSQIIESLLKKL